MPSAHRTTVPFAAASRALASWLPAAIDLVFPARCRFCGSDLGDGDREASVPTDAAADRDAALVCSGCAESLAGESTAGNQRPSRCDRCGVPSVAGVRCGRCGSRPWCAIAVLGGYDGDLRRAVLRGKRAAGEDACRGLAELWLRHNGRTARSWNCDRVVPVPLHWTRRMTRGSSATETLAGTLARGLGLPMRSSLRRVRRTRMQNELAPEDRPRNVRGAFHCGERLAGARVLLVDDVVTTAATIDACVRELLRAGAGEVFVAAMAKADRAEPARSDRE